MSSGKSRLAEKSVSRTKKAVRVEPVRARASSRGEWGQLTAHLFSEWGHTIAAANAQELIILIRHGVEPEVLQEARHFFDLDIARFSRIVASSPATISRAKSAEKLNQSISERLVQLGQIEVETEEVFGSAEKAKAWLTTRNHVLNAAPIDLLDTAPGVAEVRRLLSAIEYGGVV